MNTRPPRQPSRRRIGKKHGGPYTPYVDSTAWRAISFFIANPDEELETLDACTKFDASRRNVHKRLQPAVDAGYLVRKTRPHSNGGTTVVYVYTAGPTLPQLAPVIAAHCATTESTT